MKRLCAKSKNAALAAALQKERESARKVMATLLDEAADYQIEIQRQIKNASDVTLSGERLATLARQSLKKANEETRKAKDEVRLMKKTLKLKSAGRIHETLLSLKKNSASREKNLQKRISNLQKGKLELERNTADLNNRNATLESRLTEVQHERDALRNDLLAVRESLLTTSQGGREKTRASLEHTTKQRPHPPTPEARISSPSLGLPPSFPPAAPPVTSAASPHVTSNLHGPQQTPASTTTEADEHPLWKLQQSIKRLRHLEYGLEVAFRDEIKPASQSAAIPPSESTTTTSNLPYSPEPAAKLVVPKERFFNLRYIII